MKKSEIIKSGDHNIEIISNGAENFDAIVLCFHGFNGDRWGDGFGFLKRNLERFLVCSFDSAGHGKSGVASHDMRLDIILKEIDDVVSYLKENNPGKPIILYAVSYGGYRVWAYLMKYRTDIRKIIFANPAFDIVPTLEDLKGFKREELVPGELVKMKSSLGKFMTKEFVDDLYETNVYSNINGKHYIIDIIVGERDTLIPLDDTLRFAEINESTITFVDEPHCFEKDETMMMIAEKIKEIL